jgi:group I intron endonuclease
MLVYLITNTINGKRYVGQTKRTLVRRWAQHCKSTGCCALNSAIRKYGAENFIIDVICEPPTKELLDEFEIEYIKRYNTLYPNGYNLQGGGDVPWHNEETKRKIGESNRGKRPSLETRKKMSEAQSKRLPPSEESKRKMSEAQRGNKKGLGHKLTEEHLNALRRPRSLETRQRMSKPKSEEHRRNIGLGHTGMKRSAQAIANMKAAQQARRLKESNVGPRAEDSTVPS